MIASGIAGPIRELFRQVLPSQVKELAETSTGYTFEDALETFVDKLDRNKIVV